MWTQQQSDQYNAIQKAFKKIYHRVFKDAEL